MGTVNSGRASVCNLINCRVLHQATDRPSVHTDYAILGVTFDRDQLLMTSRSSNTSLGDRGKLYLPVIQEQNLSMDLEVRYSKSCWCSANYTAMMYTKTTTVLWPFIQDCPGEPVPDETFTHSHLS